MVSYKVRTSKENETKHTYKLQKQDNLHHLNYNIIINSDPIDTNQSYN
jgi:hypothetical protein